MTHQIPVFRYLMIALLLAVQSCYIDLDDDGFNCESGNGTLVTENRVLPSFHTVINTIGADVVIRQDIDEEFRITAPRNIMDNITTHVSNGELIIDHHRCVRNANIEIYISNPEIAGVHNVGSGTVIGDNVWQTDRLSLSITGSGHLDAEVLANRVDADIIGSGSMDLYGDVDRSFIRISGSGDIFAFNMESNDQDILISGSGDCEVFAHDILDVRISGSGNVFYKGNPSISTSISGSGNVIEAN